MQISKYREHWVPVEIRGVGGYPKGSSGKTRGLGGTLELCGEYRGDFINFPPKTQ